MQSDKSARPVTPPTHAGAGLHGARCSREACRSNAPACTPPAKESMCRHVPTRTTKEERGTKERERTTPHAPCQSVCVLACVSTMPTYSQMHHLAC